MSFTFAMRYYPAYQKRYGLCAVCHQGILKGSQIMVGVGYFNKQLIRNHNHYGCWLEKMEEKARDWFFANEYRSIAMAPEKKAELNRLRAKRYYIRQKGGEPNEVMKKLEEVEKQIALVKAR
jgi:hypothetical protein